MKDLDKFDISVEEFDAIDENHVFSDEYESKKKNMLRDYRKSHVAGPKVHLFRAVAAAMVTLVSTPLVVNAATGGELFRLIWGNENKKTIEAHTETYYDEVKGKDIEVTYPEREYVEVDEEKADIMIGDYMIYPNQVEEVEGYTFTIESIIRDRNGGAINFTLENPNGVDMLEYDQESNESKGAAFTDAAPFWFSFTDTDGNDMIYVDLEKSTDTKLYCVAYIASGRVADLHIVKYPGNMGEWIAAGSDWAQVEKSTIKLPYPEVVPSQTYMNAGEGTLDVSPLSIKIDMGKGLGLEGDEKGDPGAIEKVVINYKDGSQYLVEDMPGNVDNTTYGRADLEHHLTLVFNRLVDVNEIKSIIVNETEYLMK